MPLTRTCPKCGWALPNEGWEGLCPKCLVRVSLEAAAGEAEPEEDEKIISRAYSRKQLDEMIGDGKLRDAKSIAGILYYFRYLAPQGRVKKS